MRKTTLYIMFLTIIIKIIGFFREIILAYFYGASNISDAYLIAITVPSMIFGFVAAGLSSGYIPLYNKIESKSNKTSADLFTSNLINLVLVLSTIVIAFCLFFTEEIIRLLASGFDVQTFELTVIFTRISIFAIYFIGLVSILTGYLQVKGAFLASVLVGLPLNLINIIAIILSNKLSMKVLVIGFVIASLSQVLILAPFVARYKYKYSLKLNLFDPNIINMVYISIPIIIGISVNQINVLVDRTIASGIIEGGISALNYANRLNLFIQGIFVTSISIVIYPSISRLAIKNETEKFKSTLIEAITGISLFIIPITVGAMIYSEPIIRMLFGRGAFDTNAINITSNALFYYSIGMLGYGLREILSKAFYSFQDTKTPMINATVGVVLNIILNLLLSRYLGIGGLALATSISATITTLLLYRSLKRKIGSFVIGDLLRTFLKIVATSLVMGYVSLNSFWKLSTLFVEPIALMVAIMIGILIYITILINLRIKEVENLVLIIKNKLGMIKSL